ncbi:HAD hydrolase family protein [Candidatus Saccharibacteria bacterium]|nr:HAD-IIIA family hydrolase [Candidatus Saccharibacteria bacterium]NIV03213.1 HAD hydrolase family protein [Calditrichia bacterium]NIV71325.1 HAD hydrolase family protein [Calditrichia bacterium]NIV97817.1 HAD hydrolase family protein [Candidatus Saccharibacteria bacterium]NIW79189.1 HAD hydrolase family protein [Calditrichia bacterium]
MICDPSIVGELFKRASSICAIVFDIDGCFTDGHIVYNVKAEETKSFDAHDGFGIKLAHFAGLETGIISARDSKAIRHRANELNINTLFLGSYEKLDGYQLLKKKLQLQDNQVCYIGDDLPDIPVLEKVGLPVAVNNATDVVKKSARFMTRRNGGRGAVREVVDFVLHVQGKLEDLQKQMLEQMRR